MYHTLECGLANLKSHLQLEFHTFHSSTFDKQCSISCVLMTISDHYYF